MKTVKALALVAALFVAQSITANATPVDPNYDFGLMGPPGKKTIDAIANGSGDTDIFTFTINAPADASGTAPDVEGKFEVEVKSVSLFDSNNKQIGKTDYDTDKFSFSSIGAGSYYLSVVASSDDGKSFGYKVTLTTTASAVPEPEEYAMMLAGLGLVGFAARRKLA